MHLFRRTFLFVIIMTLLTTGFLSYRLFGHAEDRFPISATNPTPENNPPGKGFPGVRGADQLILYTPELGRARTGTNSFGVELRVQQGRIMENTGFDSSIQPNQVILSGHGKAARWLLQHAPIGTRVLTENGYATVLDSPDAPAFAFQTMKSWAMNNPTLRPAAEGYTGKPVPEDLEAALWPAVAPFPKNAPYGVWHRPQAWEMAPATVAITLKRFKAMGMNTVYLETLMHGLPIFPSETFEAYGIEPNAYPKKSEFMGKPLLQIWVEEAHKLDMKLVAWVQMTYAGNADLKIKSPILEAYPEWANRQREFADVSTPPPSAIEPGHYFMDPANASVRRFLIDFNDELATRFAVDGIQLDYIRYPASLEREAPGFLDSTWGYTPAARRKFSALYEMDPLLLDERSPLWRRWEQFKAEQVDAMVREIRQHQQTAWKTERQQKSWPALELTAAVFPDMAGPHGIKHQNWPQWMREGLLDRITPMVLTPTPQPVCTALQGMRRVRPGFPITPGLFSPYYNSDSYAMLQQLGATYTCGGDGALWFQSEFLKEHREKALVRRMPPAEAPSPSQPDSH
jgi:uncharacterized lipoprotein YddW (UPF0748 family)